MSTKSQSSFEMLLIFMIAITILVPVVIYVSIVQTEYSDSYKISTGQNVVNRLAEAADTIFLQGSGTRISLTLQFPDSISSTSIGNGEISIKITTSGGEKEVYQTTKEPVSGTLPNKSGVFKIRIENKGDFVQISQEL